MSGVQATNAALKEWAITAQGARNYVYTSAFDVYVNRRGVCQDFAHLQIACLRSPTMKIDGGMASAHPREIVVESEKTLRVEIQYDSGMR